MLLVFCWSLPFLLCCCASNGIHYAYFHNQCVQRCSAIADFAFALICVLNFSVSLSLPHAGPGTCYAHGHRCRCQCSFLRFCFSCRYGCHTHRTWDMLRSRVRCFCRCSFLLVWLSMSLSLPYTQDLGMHAHGFVVAARAVFFGLAFRVVIVAI